MVEYPIVVANYTVYVHVNKINQKKYVGITRQNPLKRWGNGGNYNFNQHFKKSIQKYGWDEFQHIILYSNITYYDAVALEQIYINALNTTNDNYGYNIFKGGTNYKQIDLPSNYHDITGHKYNRLTVLYRNGSHITPSGIHKTIWHCKCICGNEIDVSYQDIVSGHTKSCGCLNYEKMTMMHPNRSVINDDTVYVYLNRDRYFIVNKSDYDLIKNYRWRIDKYNNIISEENNQHERIMLKKMLLKYRNKRTHVSFINGNYLDYRIDNLLITPKCNVDQLDYQFYVYMDLPPGSCLVSDNNWMIYDKKTQKKRCFSCFEKFLLSVDQNFGTNYLSKYKEYRQKVI